MAISTNGTVLARLAGGLYNQTLSNATYEEVVATVKSAADINTLANDLYARDFASKTDLAVATTLVSNLGLSSITGLNNWVSAQLTAAGAAGKGAKIVSLLNDLSNLTSDATYGSYATAFNAKSEAALALSQTAGSKGGDFAAAATLAAADAAAAAAKAAADAAAKATADAAAQAAADAAAAKVIADAEAAAAAAKAAADAAAAKVIADAEAAAKVPQKFVLTVGLDTGDTFTGNSGNDTFNAVDALTDPTLTDGDSLVGGAGTDTLVLAVASTATANAPGVSTDGVETLAITQNRAAGYTLDASLMTGLSTVKVTAGAGDTTVSNSAAILNAEIVSSQQDVNITAASTATLGAADSANISLSGSGTTAPIVVTNDGVETFNVTLTGARSGSATVADNKVTLDSDELETVNVSGTVAARLAVEFVGAAASTQTAVFNAAEASGGITAGITLGASGKAVITGGAGNDSITVTVTKTVTVTGGAGTDTLVASGSYDTTSGATQPGANVSGFEKASGTLVDQRAFPSNSFTESTGAGSYSYLAGTFTTASLSATGDLIVDRATDAAADTLTVNMTTAAGGTHVITAAEEESITLNAAGTTAGVTHTVTLSAVKATSLTVTGSNALDLGATDSTVLATVNAGAHSGATFAVDASASNVAMTITGSAGAPVAAANTVNTLTGGTKGDAITGGAYKDVLSGGNGADTIDGGAGNDVITGGSGADVLIAGEGDNSADGGTGDDSITAGDGNDTLIGGGGSDTISSGGGIDLIVVSSLNDDTSIDGGTGSDILGASSTATLATAKTSYSTAVLAVASYADVTDDAAPTVSLVETGYVQVTTAAGNIATAPLVFDMSNVTGMTTLYLDMNSGDDFATVKNFSGSSVILSDVDAPDGLTLDGTGQATLTVTLDNFDADAADTLTVTGVTALTLANRSASLLTANALTPNQGSILGVVTAASASSVTLSTAGSTSTNATALAVDSLDATAAETVIVTVGGRDTLTIGALTADGGNVQDVTITVGSAGVLDINTLDFSDSSLDTLTLNVSTSAALSTSTNATATASEDVAVSADSIALLDVNVNAAGYASLDLTGIEVTAGTFTIDTAATLVLDDNLGLAATDSSFTFDGRGTLLIDDGADITAGDNAITLVGAAVTFNASALETDTAAITIVASAVTTATIKTAGGDDVITTGTGNDALTGGNGADTLTGAAGNDSIVLTETVSAADVVVVNAVADVSSDSKGKGTLNILHTNVGQDTITGFAWTVDTILIVATAVADFVHATDTTIGTATGVAGTGIAADFTIGTGLIELGGDAAITVGDGDIALTFSSPSATLTEALFEAALQYNITGTADDDTITTGALADTIDGGLGDDTITGGDGDDTINANTGEDTIIYAATAALNGEDTVTGLTAGDTADVLDFTAFLGAAATAIEGAGAAAEEALAAVTAGAEGAGTDLAGTVFLWGGTITELQTAIVTATANDKLFLASGAKTVALVGTLAENEFEVYYITGTGTNGETATLVGTTTFDDGAALTALNFA
jgi:hypothetical protein